MNGYSIVLIPSDWQFGSWHKPNGYRTKKSIYAFGPFRFVIHRNLGAWKPDPAFEPAINRGQWLKGPSPSERIGDAKGTPAGNCMEPVAYKRTAEPEREGFHGGARSGPLGFDG